MSKPTPPEIRINFSPLLFRNESNKLAQASNSPLEKPKDYLEKANLYRQAWLKYESIILSAITETLGVTFYRSVIDVHLAPHLGNKSTPLIINFRSEPDRFIDVLTHELLHILQNDNNKYQAGGKQNNIALVQEWQKLFGEHQHLCLVHIPLHALHKYIYLDVLKSPKRLERDIEAVSNSPTGQEYVQAWDYVNKNNYLEIIENIKRIYQ